MQIPEIVTSALRRRKEPVAQNPKQSAEQGRGINRWALYKQLCVAKSEFDLNDRCLAVLSSLLSFLPDDQMRANHTPVVFPSNRQLSLRAHGMAESTLRRHLSSLIKAGIIERKNSPNGKRYAHKDGAGAVELAFGFSFMPLIERASEITQKAEAILDRQLALKLLRDKISVTRREIAAIFETDEVHVSVNTIFCCFREVVDAIPRRASFAELTAIKAQLDEIKKELSKLLENKDNNPEMSGSVAQSERQHIESLPESLFDFSNAKNIELKAPSPESLISVNLKPDNSVRVSASISLDQVLRTCPDIREYGANGIASWRDLHNASRIVSGFLGISRSAYEEAMASMGAEIASTVIAWILQKMATINSPGGYLRSLTQKAREGGFSINRLLFSEMKANQALSPT